MSLYQRKDTAGDLISPIWYCEFEYKDPVTGQAERVRRSTDVEIPESTSSNGKRRVLGPVGRKSSALTPGPHDFSSSPNRTTKESRTPCSSSKTATEFLRESEQLVAQHLAVNMRSMSAGVFSRLDLLTSSTTSFKVST